VSGIGASGNGVTGSSEGRFGVEGHTQTGDAGVHGRGDNEHGRGVLGISDGAFGAGVAGVANGPQGVGVLGNGEGSPNGWGVRGAGSLVGAGGLSTDSIGAMGFDFGTGVGVLAVADNGTSLEARGSVSFRSAGRESIPRQARWLDIDAGVPVPEESAVLTTLEQGNQQAARRQITHVEKLGGSRFRVHLDARVGEGFLVNWFVISAFGTLTLPTLSAADLAAPAR
jgi:hypothetical protein